MRLRLVPEGTRFDFMKFDRIMGPAGIALAVLSLVAVALLGLNLGIDFRGGTMILAETPERVEVGAVRDALTALGVGDVSVSRVVDPAADLTGAAREAVMIRIEQQAGDDAVQAGAIAQAQEALRALAPNVEFLAVDSVGAKVSEELFFDGALALALAIVAILIYIWLRFEWQFALGAVAALVHDVALTLGVFAVTRFEFNLAIIAALLTIIGYSLNDTVVVFDRVRENLRRYKTTPLDEVLNLSINETLARTVMTSATTLVALIALFLFGGEVIRGFTFAMIFGVLVGTHSSIFVASLVLSKLGVDRSDPDESSPAGVRFGSEEAP
jgi:preprotein translocase subunit SecF